MKKYIAYISITLLFILCSVPMVYANVSQNNENNTYTIIFKSGDMGELINAENEKSECISYENILENARWDDTINIPVVCPDAGYLFVGWSKEYSNEIILNFPNEIKKNETYIANFAPIYKDDEPKEKKPMSILYRIFLFCKNI